MALKSQPRQMLLPTMEKRVMEKYYSIYTIPIGKAMCETLEGLASKIITSVAFSEGALEKAIPVFDTHISDEAWDKIVETSLKIKELSALHKKPTTHPESLKAEGYLRVMKGEPSPHQRAEIQDLRQWIRHGAGWFDDSEFGR